MGECRDRRLAAEFTSAPSTSFDRPMDTPTANFVTVDMRGLKAALVAHAKTKRLTVSVVVRDAVARVLPSAGGDQPAQLSTVDACADTDPWTKLSIRFTRAEAARLSMAARAAGLSRGAYLAGLADGVPVLTPGGNRPEAIAALSVSCSELSTLSRNVYQLTALLREGNVRRALDYREILDDIADQVRCHLQLAASLLVELRARGADRDGAAGRLTERRACRKA